MVEALVERISVLPPRKQARVLSFIRLVESEPDEDSMSDIYEELSPEEEDRVIRNLSFASGVWDE